MRCEAEICKPDGSFVEQKDSITYLGSVLSSSGHLGTELGRRLGAALSEFRKLERVWSHSTLSADRKLRIFEACVLSKLLYCLHTAWLNKHELARLDAFQAKCLRQILRIPHSYMSRVTNKSVLQQALAERLSTTLLKRQLLFLAHVARKPGDDPVRRSVLTPFSCELQSRLLKRKRGRPRLTWGREVYKHALSITSSLQALHNFWQDTPAASAAWHAAVQRYCSTM